MRFPGKRKNKHFFPITEKGRVPATLKTHKSEDIYIVGIDQLLVDIEISVSDDWLEKNGIAKGESILLDDKIAEEIYIFFKANGKIVGEYAGGAIGNTLHNFTVLSDERAVLLGAIAKNIAVGDYAFKYICNTSARVDLNYVRPMDKLLGRAFCFVTGDGERTFGISKGCMNDLSEEYVNEEIIKKSSLLLITAYLLRDDSWPIFKATMKAVKIAKANNIPIALTMGTSSLVLEKKNILKKFIKENVTIVAMNEDEAAAFTSQKDPLLAAQECLDITDMVLITVGERGLYMGGHVDKTVARMTKSAIRSKSIVDYNKYEYSIPMRKVDCENPIKIYSHINPFMGGPLEIKNTNGAGDAALASILHDIAANRYHRELVPDSLKHKSENLTYSSLSQLCKYANRVSYEVLKQNSPRLLRGLPEREEALEQSYWEL